MGDASIERESRYRVHYSAAGPPRLFLEVDAADCSATELRADGAKLVQALIVALHLVRERSAPNQYPIQEKRP